MSPSMRLAGPLADAGQALVVPCPADWRRWNFQAEPIKTAALLRSEREAKPGGAAIVRFGQGKGQLSGECPGYQLRRS